jgi:FkbM family methyltransferase
MSFIGRILQSNFPKVYTIVTSGINKMILRSRPYSIYITDGLGGSFKDYLVKYDMPLKINLLKRDLDPESIDLVDVITKRVMNYPDEGNKQRIQKNAPIIGGLLPVETKSSQQSMRQQIHIETKEIRLPTQMMEESVFYFYHGLRLLPTKVIESIRGQHFIDVGAYIGDSAIALYKYQYSKIFSLEISQKSIDRFQLNLRNNKIPSERFLVINTGVASSDKEPPIQMFDTGSAGFSPYRITGRYDKIEVQRKSIDSIVNQYSIEPKFIKVDIEGAAMDFVKGAQKTLSKFRPVLSVAIYHNPIEFFEVKPALEQLLMNYTFLIRKLSSQVKFNQIHSEVVLLAYPNELLN